MSRKEYSRTMVRTSPDAVVKLLSSKKVVELEDIRKALGGVSRATVFRRLQDVPYRSSYNHNGRYYSLYDPRKCDRHGLWSHGDILFARDGSLQDTAVRLVQESEAGLTQRELQDLLGVRVQTFLLSSVREGLIDRDRVEGVYLYLHGEPSVRKAQKERRREQVAAAQDADAELKDEVVIQVLLQLVRNPAFGPQEVARRLRRRAPPIGLDKVQAVFARYDLGQKGGRSKH